MSGFLARLARWAVVPTAVMPAGCNYLYTADAVQTHVGTGGSLAVWAANAALIGVAVWYARKPA